MSEALPIDPHVGTVRACLDRHRAAVLVAGPGAGKTTRVPPALVDHGRVIVLQPRRVAARAVAARIAEERGWTHRPRGRLARALRPALHRRDAAAGRHRGHPHRAAAAGSAAVRRHHGGLRRVPRAQPARRPRAGARPPGLAGAIRPAPAGDVGHARHRAGGALPATTARWSRCPGAAHPLAVEYAPGERPAAAVRRRAAADARPGPLLPARAARDRHGGRRVGRGPAPSLASRSCRCTAASTATRRTGRCGPRPPADGASILATNLAETSLTVPGVSVVVDSGLVKVARYDAARGVDRLDLERVTADSATQRAGRAARLGPGLVAPALGRARSAARVARARHRPGRPGRAPCSTSLAWGADPRAFEWFEPPPEHALEAAVALLVAAGRRRGDRRARAGDAARPPVAALAGARAPGPDAAGRPRGRRTSPPPARCSPRARRAGRAERRRRATCWPISTASQRSRRGAPGGRGADAARRAASSTMPPPRRSARAGCAAPSLPASPIAWPGGVPAPATG